MNMLENLPKLQNKQITFCIVDDISTYEDDQIRITIRNICDFTISNLFIKGYKVLKGFDENSLLEQVSTDYAVVMSPGTEYINGFSFFKELNKLLEHDFFVAGHILDRTMHDAYYELHHQCYVINMNYYKKLKYPNIGVLEKNSPHIQITPIRSKENFHDNYTPKFVKPGTNKNRYNHKCHGWNLLRLAFENNLPIIVFNENIRNNKKHYYPENKLDFYKNLKYILHKIDYCKNNFIHHDNTEWSSGISEKYEQVVIPASGTLYLDLIEKGKVIFFDYNQRALDYWQKHCPRKENIEYIFVNTDLINDLLLIDHLDKNLKTFINLSNIFCYEGTSAKYSLKQRETAEKRLVSAIENKIKNVQINFTLRANSGH